MAENIAMSQGRIDLISDEGYVVGWAWYPEEPERRVELELLINGEAVGACIANLYREDVAGSGIGDGKYGFSIAIPYHALASGTPQSVTIRDFSNGLVLCQPVVFEQPGIKNVGHQLDALGRDVKLLQSALSGLKAQERLDSRSYAALFQTVSAFFAQLADVTLAGESPRDLRTLKEAVSEATNKYQQLDFSGSTDPAISICVIAEFEIDAVYQTLLSLKAFFDQSNMELLVLDIGSSLDAPLLPLIAGNARYMRRTGLKASEQFDHLARAARGEVLLFITEPVVFQSGWVEDLPRAFAQTGIGVGALKIVGGNGVVESAGAMLKGTQCEVRCERSNVDTTLAADVDAALPRAFLVLKKCFDDLGGFKAEFELPKAALAEFCLRAAGGGWRVSYFPEFAVEVTHEEPRAHKYMQKIVDDQIRLEHIITSAKATDDGIDY
ncbi:glycosyltransferase family 2 protein [Acidocella facilis]|uniref:glycosyltransferase family 2 protein n=1 Tax=Acidocella facilis TaxID=525 RepID=UPI001F1DBCEA|nr:glycosyltransferase [Acidocella facilis]